MGSVDKSDKLSQNQENNKKTSCDNYLSFFCWVFSITIWCLIIFIIIVNSKSEKDYEKIKGAIYAIICCYILYLIVEFFSSTSKFLCKQKNNKGVKYQMGEYFEKYPTIRFHCKCYHYEKRKIEKKNKKGHDTKKVKVVTHTDSYDLEYRSSRDVSGLLNLKYNNDHKDRKGRISYVKLFLKKEINFADPISVKDYITQKDSFWRKNRFRDTFMDFREERNIPGLIENNPIIINDEEPCSVNIYWFIFFTILTLAQLYKSYVNCYSCDEQKFTIRKIISTRYDLNSDKDNKQYKNLIPQINLNNSQINFDINQYTYVNQNAETNLPTKEEIEEAEKKYKDEVPVYEVYQNEDDDEKGIMKKGTVKDNLKFSVFNCEEAPPAFIQVAGKIGLSS